MWSFALLDTIEEELIICRDRYGVKLPIYTRITLNSFFHQKLNQ